MTEAPHRSTSPETLTGYHAEVEEAVRGLGADLAGGAGLATAVDALDHRLTGPGAAHFLDAGQGGRAAALGAVRRQLERTGPVVPSNPQGPAALARIVLLHRVDALWWGQLTPYADATAVTSSRELVPLASGGRRAGLEYAFAVQPNTLWGRGRERARRRLRPDARPQVAGIKFVVARRQMVLLLDELGAEFRERTSPGTQPLWVNSVVRSVEHQRHLAELGYVAQLPSAHCVGWAADLEVRFFERYDGAAESLRELLRERRDQGSLNVIDEGQAWHVCVSPDNPLVALAGEGL